MKKLELIEVEHSVKIGDICEYKEPNILEDTMFTIEGEPVGFFLKQIEGKLKQFIEIANTEFRSERVPKAKMDRDKGWDKSVERVKQYSTIIGSVPPRVYARRPYPNISSVHNTKSARTFIKAMLGACREAEDLLQELMPEQFEKQLQLIEDNVPPKYRFGRLFTSSISNYNISARYHRDGINIKGCVNVIINKKHNATGGDLNVPDYGATMDGTDNSILVYPAWKNVHGVTPITPTQEGGYRNSLVFYALNTFKNAK